MKITPMLFMEYFLTKKNEITPQIIAFIDNI